MKILWTLDQAQIFCTELEKNITNFGVGLTGSVLKNKQSSKDLDIILYPLSSNADNNLETLKSQLINFGMTLFIPNEQVIKHWRKKGSIDEKYVEIWLYNNKRVDIFLLK